MPPEIHATHARTRKYEGIGEAVQIRPGLRRGPLNKAVYDRHSYDPEKRTALEAWVRRLDGIVSGVPKKGQIVALAAGRHAATG